jgi:hypothetical protein
MSLSVIGTAVVGSSKNTHGGNNTGGGMANMGSMTITTISSSPENVILNFFSGFWGEVILLVSFASMLFGIWFTGKRKAIPLAVAGITILYFSMYTYYSIALQIIGAVIVVLAYISAYNYRFAKIVKLV